MKFFGFITARSDSSRLSHKMLLSIRGRKVIEHVIDRAKMIHGLDGIVLCTTDRAEDDELARIAEAEGILCFRGNLEDKLDRWKCAAERFGADYIITLDGDDPFFGPELIEQEIAQIKKEEPDFLNIPKGLVCGGSEFGIKTKALQKVCEIKDTGDTEMMWVYFTDTGLFKVSDFKVADPIYWNDHVRLTLDYPEDLEFFKRVFEELDMRENTVPLHDIMELLVQKPEIAEINFFRQSEFLDNQKKKTTLKLKDEKGPHSKGRYAA